MVEFVSELWDLFKIAVLPIMISVSYDVLKRFKSEKTGRTMWINSLRTCKEIDKPLNEFENATVFESKKMMFDMILKPLFRELSFTFTFFTTLLLISLYIINLYPITQPFFHLFIGLLIVAINFSFNFNVDETKFNDTISYENRFKDLIIRKSRMNYKIFYFNSFALYLIYVYGKKIYEQAISDTMSLISLNELISIIGDNYIFFIMSLLWVLGVVIGMHTYLLTKNNYDASLSKCEIILNSKYKAGYPFVKTNIPKLKGKVESIFDKEFLILNCNGVKRFIPWDSLKYLEISYEEF